ARVVSLLNAPPGRAPRQCAVRTAQRVSLRNSHQPKDLDQKKQSGLLTESPAPAGATDNSPPLQWRVSCTNEYARDRPQAPRAGQRSAQPRDATTQEHSNHISIAFFRRKR